MKTNLRHLLTAAGFAMALTLIAAPLNAQQGKFSLPVEAHWGNAVLEPGDYRILGPAPTSSIGVIYIYGGGKAQMALPAVSDTQKLSGHSYLRLINVGGTYVIREFSSGYTGHSYLFGIPKTLRLRMTPQADHDVAGLMDIAVTGN